MKLLKKLVQIFKQDESRDEQTKKIELKDIELFLLKKQDEIETKFNEKKEILYNELYPIIDKLEEHVQQLKEIDITKHKAEEKIIKMTELGRREYINAINKLIENLRKKGKYEINYIRSKINEFAEYSVKSDFKATLLIGKEIENIRNDIIKINLLEKDFLEENMKLIENRININNLLGKNAEKKKNEKIKLGIIKEIEKTKQMQQEHEKELDKINKKIQDIKESEEYRERELVKNELNQKIGKLKEMEFKIKTMIDRKILEKYVYTEENEINRRLVQQYLKDASKALLQDDNLQIMNIITIIKEKIQNNELAIKEPEKSIQKINIEKATILNYKDNLIKLNKEIDNLNIRIKETNISVSEIETERIKLEDKLEENKNNLIALEKKQEKMDKIISQLDFELTSEFGRII